VLNDELLSLLQKAGCWTVMDFLDQDQNRLAEASTIAPDVRTKCNAIFGTNCSRRTLQDSCTLHSVGPDPIGTIITCS
jgi:hypothetical protein